MLALKSYDYILYYILGKDAVISYILSWVYFNDCKLEISIDNMKT